MISECSVCHGTGWDESIYRDPKPCEFCDSYEVRVRALSGLDRSAETQSLRAQLERLEGERDRLRKILYTLLREGFSMEEYDTLVAEFEWCPDCGAQQGDCSCSKERIVITFGDDDHSSGGGGSDEAF